MRGAKETSHKQQTCCLFQLDRGFCPSSFRGHFRSLVSPDYSVYWLPFCHRGCFIHHPHWWLISTLYFSRTVLICVSCTSLPWWRDVCEASGTWNNGADAVFFTARRSQLVVIACLSSHTLVFLPLLMGCFIFICLPRLPKRFWEESTNLLTMAVTLWWFFCLFFFLLEHDGADWSGWQSVIVPVHLSASVWPVVMCQQTVVFFQRLDLLYLMSSQADKCSLFVKILLLLGRAAKFCLGRKQIPAMGRKSGC